MFKKGIVISARGKGSFTKEQINVLRESMDVTFYERLDLFDNEEFIKLVKDFEIIGVTRRTMQNIGKEIFERLPLLKGIAIYSTGYEWIDMEYLKERGILLSYLPNYCKVSVAEHTLAMILTLSRRIHLTYDYARGIINNDVSLRGFELRGKTVGIIGYGRIGQETARLVRAFGTRVIYYDKKVKSDSVEFNQLLRESDIIVINCSKKRDQKPIINKEEIQKVKKGVVIVNSARADLVDNSAIIWGIEQKIIFGYGVDDKVKELSDANLEPGRVLQTSHTAWYSTEAIKRGTNAWVENLVGLATGNYENIVEV